MATTESRVRAYSHTADPRAERVSQHELSFLLAHPWRRCRSATAFHRMQQRRSRRYAVGHSAEPRFKARFVGRYGLSPAGRHHNYARRRLVVGAYWRTELPAIRLGTTGVLHEGCGGASRVHRGQFWQYHGPYTALRQQDGHRTEASIRSD